MPRRPHTWGSVHPELAAAGRFTPPPPPPSSSSSSSLLFLHLTVTSGTTHRGGGASLFAPSCHVRAVVYGRATVYFSFNTLHLPGLSEAGAGALARKERQRPAGHLDPSGSLLRLDPSRVQPQEDWPCGCGCRKGAPSPPPSPPGVLQPKILF